MKFICNLSALPLPWPSERRLTCGPGNSLSSRSAGFVDADNDGVCDNRGSGSGAGFVDADNDGVCDNRGSGSGAGFVDADNDGVCDNRGSCNGARRGNA